MSGGAKWDRIAEASKIKNKLGKLDSRVFPVTEELLKIHAQVHAITGAVGGQAVEYLQHRPKNKNRYHKQESAGHAIMAELK
jgi:hypothetical protein